MSGQLRTLRNRIRSVENTKKITRAMEMVAAAKLRRFQDMMNKSRAYTHGLEELLKRVTAGSSKKAAATMTHPFIKPREEKNIALLLITSDAGLCGSYNNDLIQTALRFIRERKTKPVLISVGKSGVTALKKELTPRNIFTDLRASRVEEILAELQQTLETLFLENEVDAIYVVYSHFKNLTTYKSTVAKLLPLETPTAEKTGAEAKEYIFEPSPEILFQKLIPKFFEAKMRLIFLESIVSEQIARMTAMNQATKNAKEMIDSLVLQRNKARQASITKELIEIVSGSRALKLK